MKRDYKDQDSVSGVKAFVGIEIENTQAKGLPTLFLDPSKLSNAEMIVMIVSNSHVRHIYLNANHYPIEDDLYFGRFEEVLQYIEGRSSIDLVTVEIQNSQAIANLGKSYLDRFQKLILNVSIPIKDAKNYANRISIKIDDVDFKATNPGVWVQPMSEILSTRNFTGWDHYKNDEVI